MWRVPWLVLLVACAGKGAAHPDRAAIVDGGAIAPRDVGACVDAYLAAHGLNEYGDPPDTMYAGGTPLFDERTGQSTPRLDYVLAHHPEIAQACGR